MSSGTADMTLSSPSKTLESQGSKAALTGVTMPTRKMPVTMLEAWKTIVGDSVQIDDDSTWRGLCPLTAAMEVVGRFLDD